MIEIGITGYRPCSMRLDLDAARSNEGSILRCINAGSLYEPEVARVLLRVLREGDTFIDVGANAGFFTLMAAALVGPAGRVLCFEPDEGNNARLRRNIALNGFGNVTVVDQPALAAVADVNLYINSDNSGGTAVWDVGRHPDNELSRQSPKMQSLVSTTVDAEIARLGLTGARLIKVDTEGADHSVLLGAAALLGGGSTPYVVAELHEFGLAQMGSSQAAFRGYMAQFGYECFMLRNDGSLPHLIPQQTRIRQNYIGNMLFSSRDAVGDCWADYLHDPGTP
jgi:FkbM family methyltransferase